MEPIVVDAASLKIRRKITMIFPNVMDESHKEEGEIFSYLYLKLICHKLSLIFS